MDGELGFELPDATSRGRQLSPLRGREAGVDPLIHPLLSSPAVHRLFADTEVGRDVAHTSASRDQVKDSLPKLRRITPSAHAVLLVGQQHASPVIRLHETQGSPGIELMACVLRPSCGDTLVCVPVSPTRADLSREPDPSSLLL